MPQSNTSIAYHTTSTVHSNPSLVRNMHRHSYALQKFKPFIILWQALVDSDNVLNAKSVVHKPMTFICHWRHTVTRQKSWQSITPTEIVRRCGCFMLPTCFIITVIWNSSDSVEDRFGQFTLRLPSTTCALLLGVRTSSVTINYQLHQQPVIDNISDQQSTIGQQVKSSRTSGFSFNKYTSLKIINFPISHVVY